MKLFLFCRRKYFTKIGFRQHKFTDIIDPRIIINLPLLYYMTLLLHIIFANTSWM